MARHSTAICCCEGSGGSQGLWMVVVVPVGLCGWLGVTDWSSVFGLVGSCYVLLFSGSERLER